VLNTIKMSDNEEDQGPKSTFTTYMAEGDQLFQKVEYVKAIECFSMVSLLCETHTDYGQTKLN